MKMRRPKDLHYSESHLWIKLEENNEATIGVTDYLIRNIETINSIRLPKVKSIIEQDAFLCEIDTDDGLITLISPISGKILSINNTLLNNFNLLLEDNYDEGWLIRIKITDPSELGILISYDEYNEFIKNELAELDEEEDEEEDLE
jgi:glycine cleavage system H protein